MHISRFASITAVVAAMAIPLALSAQTLVTLSPAASPAAGQAGVTSISVTGSGFPTGTITPANTTVSLQPAAGGAVVSTNATGVTTVVGSTRRVTFTIPGSVVVSAETAYLVAVSGTVSEGGTFTSSNKATLTVNPGASISSVAPNNGQAGQTVSVTITGLFTTFVQGSTQANFGAGISVGGAAEGALGPVTVTSATTATAQLKIDTAAASGARNVAVQTGVQQANLAGGFTVGTVTSSVGITSLSLAPVSIPLSVATSVTATAAVTGSPDAGSVQLQRLDSSGRVLATVGILHDDGLNGDPVANDGNFTLVSTFTEFAVGPISLQVTASAAGSTSHAFSPLATLTVTGTPPPTVTITAPGNLSYLNLSPTTVNGTVSDPKATVVINSVAAAVSPNGSFSAQIPLAEGPNIVTATATSTSGAAGTASITVTLDTTPPHVTITSPSDQFVTTASSLSVAGNVNDTVVGTVNSQQAQVTVNGIASQVANRTFLAMNVPLNMGSNVVTAVAVDRAGNSATTQITVIRQAPQPGQIQLISGNNQTGIIGSALSTPLLVSLTDASGSPAANKPVIFSVTQDNGMLSAGGGAPAASVMATTNAQGQAMASWTLGMRAGAGSDGVQAYSVGYSGTALFTATAGQGPAGLIVIDSGNNQTGAVNQPLAKPLIAVVVDSGNNRLAGVPVTFTVASGGGNIGGQASITVTTDSDGRAAATPTLGFQEGTSNNLITADFPNDKGFPAAFTASGLGPGNPANTIISGIVLDNSNGPVPGVTVRALLTNVVNSNSSSVQAAATVQTDVKGQFSISPAPVGLVKLFVDGSTATLLGPFPALDYDMVTVAGQNNTVGQPIFLLPINTTNQLCVTGTTGGGTLTIPEAPGFSLTFAPGQVTFPGGSKTGCVSVTAVHADKVPMVPGFGQQPRFIVTIQPSGALFNPPAPITLPNVDGLQPRAVTEMYSFDHDIGSFVAIGTGTVSDDGQLIRSNAGVGVLKAGWHCGGNPNVGGAAATCGPCNYCNGVTCVPDPFKLGVTCLSPCIQGSGMGTCSNGVCNGPLKPIGSVCNSFGGTCDANGQCTGGQCPSGCNSGNPCITDSCSSGQCVATPNQMCNTGCTQGQGCNVQGVPGTCDNGYCDLCSSLGPGASCAAGGNVPGTCTNNGQGVLQCTGSGNQCPGGQCNSCRNGICNDCQPSSVTVGQARFLRLYNQVTGLGNTYQFPINTNSCSLQGFGLQEEVTVSGNCPEDLLLTHFFLSPQGTFPGTTGPYSYIDNFFFTAANFLYSCTSSADQTIRLVNSADGSKTIIGTKHITKTFTFFGFSVETCVDGICNIAQ